MRRLLSAALLLALAAPAGAQSIVDAFLDEAIPLMLDASLTDFDGYRGEAMGADGAQERWHSAFRPATDIGPLNGTIVEIRSGPQPVVAYILSVEDPEAGDLLWDIYVNGASATAEVLDAQLGGLGWERAGRLGEPNAGPQSISWTECPDLGGGRFVAYSYDPLDGGGGRVRLQIGRSLAPSCAREPRRFVSRTFIPVDCAGLGRLVEAGSASPRFDAVRTERSRPATGFYNRFALSDSLAGSAGAWGEQRFRASDPTQDRHTRLYVTYPAPRPIQNALHEAQVAAGLADFTAVCLSEGWERTHVGGTTRFTRAGAPEVWTGVLSDDDDRLVPTIMLMGRSE